MIVDAHHHLWDISRGYTWLDGPSLAPIRRTFGVADLRDAMPGQVAATVLVEGGRCAPAEAYEHLALADDTAEIAGVVAWADVVDPGLPDTLRSYAKARGGRKLVGIRSQVQGEPDDDYLRRDDVQRGLALVAEAGLAFDFVVRSSQLPAAVAAARAIPEARFVLDHLGKPPVASGELEPWGSSLAELAGCPNVTAKLSGLVTEADHAAWTPADLRPYIHAALELFGPDRLMFGSDWPVCLLAASYHRVVEALAESIDELTADEQRAIWSGTAARSYHLRA